MSNEHNNISGTEICNPEGVYFCPNCGAEQGTTKYGNDKIEIQCLGCGTISIIDIIDDELHKY